MGVFWNSEAEVITNNKDKANEILKFINGIDTAHENYSFFDVDLSDCSIRFSSKGYGSYKSLFTDICTKLNFPILCHERVLPSQGQGYGFFIVVGRWRDGTVRSYTEIVYGDNDREARVQNRHTDDWINPTFSVQVADIPKDKLTDEMKAIIKRSKDAGININSSEHWDGLDGEWYYLNNFFNCIEEDYERVYELFEMELMRACTWSNNYDVFYQQIEEESYESEDEDFFVEPYPEEINYKKLRLAHVDN